MPLPANIQFLSDPASTRLILPPRQLTTSLGAKFVPILFGLIFAGFALFWMIGASGILETRHVRPDPAPISGPEAPVHLAPPPAAPATDWFRYIFALFGLPFLVVGLIPIGIGILSFFPSHAEIILTSDTLISVEHIGPFRKRGRRLISQIAKLRIGAVFDKSRSGEPVPDNHGIFADIAIAPGQAPPPPFRVAMRYPLQTLVPVAELLLTELQRRGSAAILHAASTPTAPLSLTIDPEPAPIAAPSPDLALEEPELPQPANSKINFIPALDVLTFIIPRTGFRGTARFFLFFSLFWDGLSFTFFWDGLFQFLHQPSLQTLGILAFISVFVAVGIATLLAAIQSAFRHSVLMATVDSLVFTQTGPIRKSEYQWPRAELTAIRCANSNTAVNDQPLKELRVESSPSAGPLQRHLLVGSAEPELQWLAATLRRFYQIRA